MTKKKKDELLSEEIIRKVMKKDSGFLSEKIIRKVMEKDSESFEILYKKHSGFIFSVLLKYVDYHTAEDLSANVWMKVREKIHTLKNLQAYLGWIKRVAINAAISEIKRKTPTPSEGMASVCFDSEPGVLEKLIKLEADQYIQQCIEDLPEIHREVVKLKLLGRKFKDISEELSIPLGTAARRYFDAKSKLKIVIKKGLTTYEE